MARTHDGKAFRLLTIIDEYTRDSRRPPDYIRSDNGPEFTAKAVGEWLSRVGVKTLYIEPGSPRGERLQRELQWQTAG
jgi:putative transposase